MSKEIDWSKAPEGYPVWIQDLTGVKPDGSGWHREEIVTDDDEPCERWTDVDGKFWPKDCEARGKIIVHRRPVEPWTGTGLPPVGTVCEVGSEKVVVVAHHCNGRHAIYAESEIDGLLYYGEPNEFLPIRTPAQVEAEERKHAIDAMSAATQGAHNWIEAFGKLHDAGYRKTEAGK